MEKKQKQQNDILNEIKKLSEKADSVKNLELGLVEFDTVDSFDVSVLDDTQNPDKSHRLFYSIQAILIQNLPRGKENLKLRNFIYEEKNDFLNRGNLKNEKGIRNSDARMSYLHHLEIAFNEVVEWVKHGANSFDLFLRFRNLNIKHGYKSKDEKKKLSNHNQSLKKALDYNPKKEKPE